MNLYYNPEKFGMEIVGTLDQEDLSYEYNTLVVWVNLDTKKIYWDKDSGCSCPIPFEDSDLTNITPLNRDTLEDFEGVVKEFPASLESKERLLGKVKELLTKHQ